MIHQFKQDTIYGRVAQPWHYWHLGPHNSSLWRYPVHYRIFSRFSGFYPLDDSNTPFQPSSDNKKCPDITKCPLEGKIDSSLEPLVKNLFFFFISFWGKFWMLSWRKVTQPRDPHIHLHWLPRILYRKTVDGSEKVQELLYLFPHIML